MPSDLNTRMLKLETDISWYKGAFWIAATVLGASAIVVASVASILFSGLLSAAEKVSDARDEAIAAIKLQAIERECDIEKTHWLLSFNYPETTKYSYRHLDPQQNMIDLPFTYLATTGVESPEPGYLLFQSTEYYHSNERYWKYTPETANSVATFETLSADGSVKRTFKRLPLPGFVFQSGILNTDAPRGEQNRLRISLVGPQGCTKLTFMP